MEHKAQFTPEDVGAYKEEAAQERRDRRKFAVIEKTHKMAEAAYAVEQWLARGRSLGKDDPELIELLEELPESLQETFAKCVRNYTRSVEDIDINKREMMEFIAKHEAHGIEFLDTPQNWGQFMYRSITREIPHGHVKFYPKEAYFVFAFEDKHDYIEATKHLTSSTTTDWIEESGGTFHASRRLEFFDDKYYGPVIMLREDQTDPYAILAHERQHFINHKVFHQFWRTEGKRNAHGENHKYWGIKDELLAYTREGSTGSRVRNALQSKKLYGHLFERLSDEENKLAVNVIEAVATFFRYQSVICRFSLPSVFGIPVIRSTISRNPQMVRSD